MTSYCTTGHFPNICLTKSNVSCTPTYRLNTLRNCSILIHYHEYLYKLLEPAVRLINWLRKKCKQFLGQPVTSKVSSGVRLDNPNDKFLDVPNVLGILEPARPSFLVGKFSPRYTPSGDKISCFLYKMLGNLFYLSRQRLLLLMERPCASWSGGRLAECQELLPPAVHGPCLIGDQ